MQVMIQWPMLVHFGFKIKFVLWHPSIKRILKMIGPAIFALAIMEINIAITKIFASSSSLAGEGAISFYITRTG